MNSAAALVANPSDVPSSDRAAITQKPYPNNAFVMVVLEMNRLLRRNDRSTVRGSSPVTLVFISLRSVALMPLPLIDAQGSTAPGDPPSGHRSSSSGRQHRSTTAGLLVVPAAIVEIVLGPILRPIARG